MGQKVFLCILAISRLLSVTTILEVSRAHGPFFVVTVLLAPFHVFFLLLIASYVEVSY